MSEYFEKLKDPRWQAKSGIYILRIGDGLYIGSAVLLQKRLRQHFNDLRAGRHTNKHLQRAFDKHGGIDFEVIEIVSEPQQLVAREQFYIDTLKPRYNIAPTAGSQLGFRHSAQSRALISRIQIGRKMSLETRRNMSAAKLGVKLTPEHRRNIAASKMGEKNPFFRAGERHPQFGVPKSKQTRDRISETSRLRGCHRGENNAASRTGVLYDVETGGNHIFRSLKPLCQKMGLPYKSVISALRGERFYAGRYYASYVNLPDCAGRCNNSLTEAFRGVSDMKTGE